MDFMKDTQTQVDGILNERMPGEHESPEKLHTAMRYAVFSGGKRLRPLFCIASAQALGGTTSKALLPAAAIELLHTYTLIHDDLPAMDNDDMRRGKPTVHKQYDEATAILAGDALLTLAFEWLGEAGDARMVQALAYATGSRGTVGGQSDDMVAKEHAITKEEVLVIHARKTAALFGAACMLGGIAAGGTEEQVTALQTFGLEFGMTFQMLDDIADADAVTLGVISKDEALQLAREHEQAAYAAIDSFGDTAKSLRDIAAFAVSSFGV